jgi:16S rRNA G1207 methylase RsmC
MSVAELLFTKETPMSKVIIKQGKTKKYVKTSLVEVVMIVQPKGETMFSEEFLRHFQDCAYETLRAHLEKTKQEKAVELLDDLILLSMRSDGKEQPTWLRSQIMCEAVASASKNIVALGGVFSLSGQPSEVNK